MVIAKALGVRTGRGDCGSIPCFPARWVRSESSVTLSFKFCVLCKKFFGESLTFEEVITDLLLRKMVDF